ncbi:MAG: oligosaccharide repeat unit polymerase [Prevotella sp.]|nr:oligosaccharide repeat unit polymerase [Prevotella sp.]
MSNRQHIRYAVFVAGMALCAYLLSYFVPDEYAAQAKITDEYKTTDLLIGLNSMNVLMRDLNPDAGNEGTDDIEVYARYLASDDFISQIGQTYIQKYQKDYLHYLDKKDTEDYKDYIREHIRYNVNIKTQTLDLQVTDKDSEVSAIVLEHALTILKREIERFRSQRSLENQKTARNSRKQACEDYHAAAKRYNEYAESHQNPKSDYVRSQIDVLQREMNMRYELYRKAAEASIRADYLVDKENTSFSVVKKYNLSQNPIAPHHWVYGVVAGLITLIGCLFHFLYVRKGKNAILRSIDFGEWFSPWSLTLSIWTVILGLYFLLDTTLYPLTSQFYYCLAIWVPIFSLCAFIVYHLSSSVSKEKVQTIDFGLNKGIFTFFFALTIVMTPLYVYSVLQIVMMFSTEDLMNNVRILAVYGEGQGILNYSIVINQSLFLVSLWAYPKVPLWQIVVLAIACLMNALAIMEKGSMFFVFISIAFVLFEKRVIKLRSIIFAGVLLLFFFYVFNLARAKTGSDYQEEETLLDFFVMYALSPPVAFCQLLPDVTPQFGTNTFESVYLFLERFGLSDIVVKDKRQEFVWVPIPTNVYTIFQPFFIDFGYKGIAFFATLYGTISGGLYRLFRNGNSTGTCLYAYMVYVLILQFYQENIFLSIVFVIQLSLFVTLFTQQQLKIYIPKPKL